VPGKASKNEVAARVEMVFELRIIGGADFGSLRQYASAPTDPDGRKLAPWNVSDRQLWRYVAAADKLAKERFDSRADHLLAQHMLRRERLYANCNNVGDYRGALNVLRDAAELSGMYDRGHAPAQPDPADTAALDAPAVARILAARLREIDRAELPVADRARLTAVVADALLRAQAAADLEARIAALEKQAEQVRKGTG
jgi:hypothetical protein